MKTQIIRIEIHDDIISIKDKMGWGQTPRILLVWPTKGVIINRRLDLVFLKRHAKFLGAQLAFVSKNADVRYYAKQLNIPVYPNIRKAEKRHWRRPRRHQKIKNDLKINRNRYPREYLDELKRQIHQPRPWLFHPATRISFFTFGVIGILAIAAIFIPSAEIKLTPKTTWQTVNIPITTGVHIDAIDLSGNLPAQVVNIIIEGRGSLPVSGSASIPFSKSQGKVVFQNKTDETITVPKDLILSTKGEDPVRFRTLESVILPPDSTSELIPVEAILAGSQGNVLSNHILVIEGPLGLDLTVTNPIGTSKGSNQLSPAPIEKDYEDLSKKLLAELYLTAVDELNLRLNPNDMSLWMDPSESEILEMIYTPENIRPADMLELTLRIKFPATIVKEEMFKDISEAVLETNLPEGYSSIPQTLEFENIQKPTKIGETEFKWDMIAKWQIKAEINPAKAIQLVLFRKPDDAIQQLEKKFPIDSNITIMTSPSWWPRLPILPFRINLIEIQSY